MLQSAEEGQQPTEDAMPQGTKEADKREANLNDDDVDETGNLVELEGPLRSTTKEMAPEMVNREAERAEETIQSAGAGQLTTEDATLQGVEGANEGAPSHATRELGAENAA